MRTKQTSIKRKRPSRRIDDPNAFIRTLVVAAHALITGAERQLAHAIDGDGPVDELRHLCDVLVDLSSRCLTMVNGLRHFRRGAMEHAPIEGGSEEV